MAALTQRKIKPRTARDLVRDYPPALLHRQIEAFDWLNGQSGAKKTPGYLVTSIRDDYDLPRGFVSKAVRDEQRRQQEAEEQHVTEVQVKEQAQMERCRRYWATLSREALDELNHDAMAAASSELRKRHRFAQVYSFNDVPVIELEIRKAHTLALLSAGDCPAA